jgi:hypothetical protein
MACVGAGAVQAVSSGGAVSHALVEANLRRSLALADAAAAEGAGAGVGARGRGTAFTLELGPWHSLPDSRWGSEDQAAGARHSMMHRPVVVNLTHTEHRARPASCTRCLPDYRRKPRRLG